MFEVFGSHTYMGDTIPVGTTFESEGVAHDHGDDHARDGADVDGPSTATINEVQLTDVTAKTFPLNEGSATLNDHGGGDVQGPGQRPGAPGRPGRLHGDDRLGRRQHGGQRAWCVTTARPGLFEVFGSHTYMGDTIPVGTTFESEGVATITVTSRTRRSPR